MTASFTNMNCVDSSVGLQTGNVVSRLNVTIDGAPDGLRAYSVSITTQSSTVIRTVTPGLVGGSDFRITAGGAGSANVTAQALDVNDDVGSFSGERTLFTIQYSGTVTPDDVTVSVNALQDDDQNSFSSTVSVENATAPGPGPAAPDLSGDGDPAKDLDGDGLYEDANGDGNSNILDVAVLLGTFDSVDAEFAALFDFTADGRINILDVSALLGMT
jgi:hypothetical protein